MAAGAEVVPIEHTLIRVIPVGFHVSLAAAIKHEAVDLGIAEFLPDPGLDRGERISRDILFEYLLSQAPTHIGLITIIQARVVVIPLVDDRHFLQDQRDKAAHISSRRVVEPPEHASFLLNRHRIAVVEIAPDKNKSRSFGGGADEGRRILRQVFHRAKVCQDDELESPGAAAWRKGFKRRVWSRDLRHAVHHRIKIISLFRDQAGQRDNFRKVTINRGNERGRNGVGRKSWIGSVAECHGRLPAGPHEHVGA